MCILNYFKMTKRPIYHPGMCLLRSLKRIIYLLLYIVNDFPAYKHVYILNAHFHCRSILIKKNINYQ